MNKEFDDLIFVLYSHFHEHAEGIENEEYHKTLDELNEIYKDLINRLSEDDKTKFERFSNLSQNLACFYGPDDFKSGFCYAHKMFMDIMKNGKVISIDKKENNQEKILKKKVSFLEQIYLGEFCPEGLIAKDNEVYQKAEERICELSEYFHETLDESDFGLLDEYLSCLLNMGEEQEKMFFKLGYTAAYCIKKECEDIIERYFVQEIRE